MHMHTTFQNFGRPTLSCLPPARAARRPRGRGFFLPASPEQVAPPAPCKNCEVAEDNARRDVRRTVRVAVYVAVTALAAVLSAPWVVEGTVVNVNPGPAMAAATSTAPAFIAPKGGR